MSQHSGIYCLCHYHCEMCVQQGFPDQGIGVPRNGAVRANPIVRTHAHAQRLQQTKYMIKASKVSILKLKTYISKVLTTLQTPRPSATPQS